MTAPGEVLPSRGERVLPPSDAGVGCPSVLDEEESAAGPQDTGNLLEGGSRVREATHRPRGHRRVDRRGVDRQLLARGFGKLDLEWGAYRSSLRHAEERERWIDADDLAHVRAI